MQFVLHDEIIGLSFHFFQRFVRAYIPDFDFAGAVIAFRNRTLKGSVSKRMVFNHHRKEFFMKTNPVGWFEIYVQDMNAILEWPQRSKSGLM